jgi:hypothetical protein
MQAESDMPSRVKVKGNIGGAMVLLLVSVTGQVRNGMARDKIQANAVRSPVAGGEVR